MKTQLLLFIAVTVLLAGARVYALPDKTFTSSGQILPGEEWNSVYIYNDDTIVDMLGGFAEGIGTYDASTVNIIGGHVNTLDATEFSTANVSGGEVYGLWAEDSGTVKLFPNGTVFSLGASGSGTTYMTGGTTEYARAGDSSLMHLYGGAISNYLNAWDSATVNIYGYDFNYDPTAGAWNGGQLTGFWLDHAPFTIDLYDAQTYSHITLIPEPNTLIVLALGALFLTRKKTT